MHRRFAAAAFAALAFLASCARGPSLVHVIHVNSLRGQVQPTLSGDVRSGGFSLLSGALASVRAGLADGPVYTVAVYNAFHGTPEAHFTDGSAVIDLMKRVGFDALVVGPREFYFGLPTLERLAAEAGFPFLSANIVQEDGSRPAYLSPFFWDPEARVGLVGLSPRSVLSQNLAQNVAGLRVVDEVEAAAAAVEELRRKGARTIGLFAGGVFWGGKPEASDTAIAEGLLALDGIDQYWFGGAADRADGIELVERDGKIRVVVTQSGARFTNGRLLAVSTLARSPEGAGFRTAAVDSTAVMPDRGLADALYAIETAVNDAMGKVIARSTADLSLDSEAECSMGNLVCDLFRAESGSDVFLLNSGKLRAAFRTGDITQKDVYDTLPFGGNIVTARMTGAQLLAVLERSCSFVGNPKAGRGFLQVSGMSFEWDPSRPPGRLVVPGSVRVGSEPLDPDRSYLVGTEAYVFGGGDGYVEFKELGIAMESFDQDSILAILQARLAAAGTVGASVEGRIVRLGAR